MAFDLYSKSRTVDFGGAATTPNAAVWGSEMFIGDAYDGILYVNLESASDEMSNISVRVSATSDFNASAATCASAAVNAIVSDCVGTPTITGGKINASDGVADAQYVFYVSKLKPFVKIYGAGDSGENGEMTAVLVATNLGEAPHKYSDVVATY